MISKRYVQSSFHTVAPIPFNNNSNKVIIYVFLNIYMYSFIHWFYFIIIIFLLNEVKSWTWPEIVQLRPRPGDDEEGILVGSRDGELGVDMARGREHVSDDCSP